ncbi:MAG: hypothetical protein QW291_00800 [Thermofilaceae archaeon]
MPRKRYSRQLELLRRSTLFTYSTVESLVGKNYAKVFVHNLKKKEGLVEVFKGVYSFKKSPYLAVKALPRAYVGLGAAAFLHGAWNQVTAVVILSPCVSLTVRGGVREIAGYKVILRKISEKMYFGHTYLHIEELGEEVRVSDPEKTAIDLVYFKHPARSEILPKLLEKSSRETINEYLHLLEERGVKGWRRVSSELLGLIEKGPVTRTAGERNR